MLKYELIICFTDHSWTTDYVEVESVHIDSDNDVIETFTEDYREKMKEGDPDLAYVGVYSVEEEEPEQIGWQPHMDEFPINDKILLASFDVYENIEYGIKCHPQVKKWVEIFEGDIEDPTIIREKDEMSVEDDGNDHIDILHHDISYYFSDGSKIEVDDCEYEHIVEMITQGYIEGELCKTNPESDETIRGFWSIEKKS
jgi:hypothetical protein